MTIITFNGNYFVHQKDFTDTLFNPLNGQTASGFYKTTKDKILFHKANGELFAAFVKNSKFTGIVSACKQNNKIWYMQALNYHDAEKYFGISDWKLEKAFEQSLKDFI